MTRLVYPRNKRIPYFIITITFGFYVAFFAAYHHQFGIGISALATLPVMTAGWYFGVPGGTVTAGLAMLVNTAILFTETHSHIGLVREPSQWIGILVLIITGLLFGKLGEVTHKHREALFTLRLYERERQTHTDFLELLNQITGMALEANSLDATLKILVERIGKLFGADDCFISLWDETEDTPIPAAAYGSISDVYPYIQFEPGDRTLTTSVMEARHVIAVPDISNSPYISSRVASIFPSRSMLGLPLIVQNRRLGALLLGYQKTRLFREEDLIHADLTAEQVALVLSKSLSLEEERRQVKQLTALHDIALISIEVDNEEELIRRVTTVIGQNVFTDNFGILLMDEEAGMLRAHPSYRFFADDTRRMTDIPLDMGVTGQVARTGKAQRIGNVRRIKEYVKVDDRTISELCVPIKFKERILGVINAESTKRDAFSPDDERLLITLAGQIATAMQQIRKTQAERRVLDQLAHARDLTYALAQITTRIEKAFSVDDIIENLGRELGKINLTCMVAIYEKSSRIFTVKYTSMEPAVQERVENSVGYPILGHKFSAKRLPAKNLIHPTVLPSLAEEIQILFTRPYRSDRTKTLSKVKALPNMESLRLPLTFEENLLGLLWIWGKELTGGDLPIMSIFAKQVGISLERARLFQEVQSLALTDPLTGLHNRRSIFELGRVEFSRAQRMEREFSCMMLDLDHFKEINDTYGHPAGDQVLKEFANRCKCSVREIDLVGRYGGEELIILLPETDRKLSMQVAERLRESIASTPIKFDGQEINLTVSIGVATKDENTVHLETLIARADQAMYIAKHKGRNRVAMSK